MKFRFISVIGIFVIFFSLLTLIFLKHSVQAINNHVVISEVQLSGATANDEFVELYNPTSTTIDLTGWKLQRETQNGATTAANLVASISGHISAHGFFLITSKSSIASNSADTVYSTNNSIAANNTVLFLNNNGIIVDKVGMGSATDAEGSTIGNPATNESVERKANSSSTSTSMTTGSDALSGNGEDTDNNAADFIIRTVSDPQNSHSPIEPIILTPTPSFTVTPTFTVTPSTSSEPSITPTFTIMPTVSPSSTPTETTSNAATATPTETEIPTSTVTPSPTLTLTPSSMVIPTPSTILEPTATPTMSIVLSPTKVITPTLITHHSHTVCSWHGKTIHFLGFRFTIPYFSCERKTSP